MGNHPQPYIAALVEQPDLRTQMDHAASGVARIRYCSTMRELCELLGHARPIAVVTPTIDSGGDDLWQVVQRASAENVQPRFLVYTDITRSAARIVAELATRALDFRLVLRSEGLLTTELAAILRDQHSAYARTPILRAVRPWLSSNVGAILVGSACLGIRKSSPGDLADLCHVPLRTMEHRLAKAGLRTPHWILGWVCTLHSLWRLEQLQRAVKEVARASGFDTRQAFTNYVRRCTGMPPVSLLVDEGFHGALRRFSNELTQRADP